MFAVVCLCEEPSVLSSVHESEMGWSDGICALTPPPSSPLLTSSHFSSMCFPFRLHCAVCTRYWVQSGTIGRCVLITYCVVLIMRCALCFSLIICEIVYNVQYIKTMQMLLGYFTLIVFLQYCLFTSLILIYYQCCYFELKLLQNHFLYPNKAEII